MNFTEKLQTIANVLQMPLTFDGKKVHGEKFGILPTPIGLTIPVRVTVVDYFCKDELGIVCDVIGDLGMLIVLFPKSKISLYLLNKAKLFSPPWVLIDSKMNCKDAVQAIRPTIAAVFDLKGTTWVPFPF